MDMKHGCTTMGFSLGQAGGQDRPLRSFNLQPRSHGVSQLTSSPRKQGPDKGEPMSLHVQVKVMLDQAPLTLSVHMHP